MSVTVALSRNIFNIATSLVALLILFSCCGVDRVRAQEFLPCNCIGPYFCNETNNSCVGESDEINNSLACIVFKQYEEDGVNFVNAKCLASHAFDYLLLCEEPFQIITETRDGVPYRTTVRYCCTTPYCNTVEMLEELIENYVEPSDLPTIYTDPPPTSPSTTTPSSVSTTTFTNTTDTPTDSTNSSDPSTPVYAVIIIVFLSLIVISILAVIAVILLLHWCHPCHFTQAVKGTSIITPSFPVDSNSYSDPSLNEDSGSGSGLPLLIQRSVSGQITLHNLIGKGRFGEVWRGVYKGDNVAVKIFHTKEEMSWFHEVEVYQTCLLRHPNVLRFIAADNKDVGLQMQLWLITDFCEFGSLFDLLTRQTFNQAKAIKLCYTAACGIDHLHTEIVGTQAKPAIAHRDLKSRNILVKADYSCCIADLGLSLTYEQATGAVKEPPRTTVGTKRYLAPEILAESIMVKNFESFKRSDIYSFGLVMWEIGRRAECDGHAEEAQLPYFDLIPSDPTLEEVRKLVCVDRRRPSLPNPWNQHEAMASLSKIIRQCWLHEAEARLTSLRIKKSLANIQELLRNDKEHEQL